MCIRDSIHFRVGGADVRWRQVCDWVAGRQAAGDPTGLLASFEGAVAQLRREVADAEARFKTLRDQAAAVTDAALEKLTAEEQQRVQVFRRKVDAAAAELDALEKEVRTASASAGDDLRDRIAAALERRRVLAKAERESRDRAAAEVQREIRRRTLLFGALDASEKAVRSLFPRVLERKNADEIQWVGVLLRDEPRILTNCNAASLNALKDRVTRALRDTKETSLHDPLLRVGMALGVKETEQPGPGSK